MEIPVNEEVVTATSPRPLVAAVQNTQRMQELLTNLGLEGTDLDPNENLQLESLVEEFSDLFAMSTFELGCTSLVKHQINTGDHKPIKQLPRRVPHFLKEEVSHHVQEMLDNGVIVSSYNLWASSVILVAKKKGTTHFSVDYRKMKSITKMDVYPLPRIDDSLDLLAECKYFTTLDLASGYWQAGMSLDSQEKIAFVTCDGL